LGVARAEGDGKWQFPGALPLFDPPRDDAKATIATARQMGVSVKMVTGDALAIARETAKKLGMGTNILDASGFGDTKRHEMAALAESIEKADGFAQVFPEHKFHIVDVLQQGGHIVGMMGDGVNNAPALKKADCGIAVSGATDAARAAAAIVLMTPGLSVIIDAIKESRKIFQRMNSYAIYRIAETLRVLLFMTLSILIFNFYPLTAVMIVMLALLNDGAILSIAYDNVHYKDQPESWNMRVVLGIATVLGVVGVVSAFGLFYLGERAFHLDRAHIQTLMYLKLSVAGHLTIFLTRTRGPPLGWLGAARLGLCSGLIPRERSREIACLSDFRSSQRWFCKDTRRRSSGRLEASARGGGTARRSGSGLYPLANTGRRRRPRRSGLRRRRWLALLVDRSHRHRSIRDAKDRTWLNRPHRDRKRRRRSHGDSGSRRSRVRRDPGALLRRQPESEGGPDLRENRSAPLSNRGGSGQRRSGGSRGSARKGQNGSRPRESGLRAP
jgi:soluble P-type ATPase